MGYLKPYLEIFANKTPLILSIFFSEKNLFGSDSNFKWDTKRMSERQLDVVVQTPILPLYFDLSPNSKNPLSPYRSLISKGLLLTRKPFSLTNENSIIWSFPSTEHRIAVLGIPKHSTREWQSPVDLALVLFKHEPADGSAGFLIEASGILSKTKSNLTPIKMGKKVKHIVTVQSSSNKTKTYEVLTYDDGSTSCNCPAWTRSALRTCKHLKFAKK
jgi:hypothetical protein